MALFSLFVIGLYSVVFIGTIVFNVSVEHVNTLKPEQRVWLQKFNEDTGTMYAAPSGKYWLGTDRLGRDIFKRVLVSIHVAFKIGLVTAFFACLIGLVMGGLAGFFGGWVDLVITWIYSVFASIPYILLVLLISAMFRKSEGLLGVYVAFGATFWIGPCRVVRGEILKLKELEYVQAARAIGLDRLTILFKHVLPNTLHLVFVYFSLVFIGAIKSEVILTFLGLGVKDMPSWGLMIKSASHEIIAGFWWQMIGASLALFVLVYAFNIFTDALQDALDPKHTQ
tara:strand:+ start:8813 stop:9658 length:846 start_codon:yes stop_codon:yes gene_type:complete